MIEKEKILYEAPKISVSEIDFSDVIATSGPLGGDDWNNGNYMDPSGWT